MGTSFYAIVHMADDFVSIVQSPARDKPNGIKLELTAGQVSTWK